MEHAILIISVYLVNSQNQAANKRALTTNNIMPLTTLRLVLFVSIRLINLCLKILMVHASLNAQFIQ